MNINEKMRELGITSNFPTDANGCKKFIDYLGKEKLRTYIPFNMNFLHLIYMEYSAFLTEEGDFLNYAMRVFYNLSHEDWIEAAGFMPDDTCLQLNNGVYLLLEEKGIEHYSMQDCLNLLLIGAYLWVEEYEQQRILDTIESLQKEIKDYKSGIYKIGVIQAAKEIRALNKSIDKLNSILATHKIYAVNFSKNTEDGLIEERED